MKKFTAHFFSVFAVISSISLGSALAEEKVDYSGDCWKAIFDQVGKDVASCNGKTGAEYEACIKASCDKYGLNTDACKKASGQGVH